MSGIVKALTEYHGEVIAGGSFTTAGGQVLAFWARWRPVGPLSDLDGDCSVGASDLLLLLANWGNPYGAVICSPYSLIGGRAREEEGLRDPDIEASRGEKKALGTRH